MKSKKINKRKYVRKNTIKKLNKKTKRGKYSKKQIKTKRFRRKRTTRTMGNISRNIRGAESNNRAAKMISRRKWKGGTNTSDKIPNLNDECTLEQFYKHGINTCDKKSLDPIMDNAQNAEDRKTVWNIAVKEAKDALEREQFANGAQHKISVFYTTRNDPQNRDTEMLKYVAQVSDYVAKGAVERGWIGVTDKNMWEKGSDQGDLVVEILNKAIKQITTTNEFKSYFIWDNNGKSIANSKIKQYPYAIQAASVIAQAIVKNNFANFNKTEYENPRTPLKFMTQHAEIKQKAVDAVYMTILSGLNIDRNEDVNVYEKYMYQEGLIYAVHDTAKLIAPKKFLGTSIDKDFLIKEVKKTVKDTVKKRDTELINEVANIELKILIGDVLAKILTIMVGDAIIQNKLVEAVLDNIITPTVKKTISLTGSHREMTLYEKNKWAKQLIVYILEKDTILQNTDIKSELDEKNIKFMKSLCDSDEVKHITRKKTLQEKLKNSLLSDEKKDEFEKEIGKINIYLNQFKEQRNKKYNTFDKATLVDTLINKVYTLVQSAEADATRKFLSLLNTIFNRDINDIISNNMMNELDKYATHVVKSFTIDNYEDN